jgi:hypothetical protein
MVRIRDLERWLSTGQVSKKTSYSRQGVINLAEDGRIRAVKTGAGWIYDPESVDDFVRQQSERRRGGHSGARG